MIPPHPKSTSFFSFLNKQLFVSGVLGVWTTLSACLGRSSGFGDSGGENTLGRVRPRRIARTVATHNHSVHKLFRSESLLVVTLYTPETDLQIDTVNWVKSDYIFGVLKSRRICSG